MLGEMNVDESVLLLGDPRLRVECETVSDLQHPEFKAQASRLLAALDTFRREQGFGRAIAAPQLGIPQRFIALRVPEWPSVIVNPVIVSRSEEQFSLWDDCLSFPYLLVKVLRSTSISVEYTAPDGERLCVEKMDLETSELLQHEIDHLNGVLAVDHAVDEGSLVSRSVFNDRLEHFRKQVDYVPPAYRRD